MKAIWKGYLKGRLVTIPEAISGSRPSRGC
jgi:non-homologous end joining protein Ku